MSKRIFYLLILLSLVVPFSVFGDIPPELPNNKWGFVYIPCDFAGSGLMMPFANALKDIWEPHGYNTILKVGQSLRDPNTQLPNFVNDLKTGTYGEVCIYTHGNPGWIHIEYFSSEASRDIRFEELAGIYGYDVLGKSRTLEGHYTIVIRSDFIRKYITTPLPGSIVFVNACYSAALEFGSIVQAFIDVGADCTFGWYNPAAGLEQQAPINIFYRMGGRNFPGGVGLVPVNQDILKNKSASQAHEEYFDPNLCLWADAFHLDMRLYNSPRIVGVLIKQGTSIIYQYGVYGDNPQSYPYEWNYGGRAETEAGMKSPASIGDEVINVKILFSSFMDEEMLDAVRVKSESAVGENYIVSGGWTGSTIFDRDVWEGTFTIDSWENTDSKAVLVVDAKDDFEGDINERLDTDGDGNSDGVDERHKFEVGDLPIVESTDPPDGATDVSVDKTPISIIFSKPMNRTITAEAVQVSFACSKNWFSDDMLAIIPDDNLDYCKDYTIIVAGTAKSEDGVFLDGDENGKPGGDYEFTFTTEKPELTVEAFPVVANVEEGGSQTHYVFTRGDQLKKDVDCRIDFEVSNPGGWSVSGANGEDFSLPQGGEHENTYNVTNNGAAAALDVLYSVGAECTTEVGEGYYWSAQGHMYDHPDENQSPGKMEYPTPWLTRTQPTSSTISYDSLPSDLPDIGILLSGWSDGYGHILGRYGMETLPVKPDLKIINNPDVDISDAVKLLVIGSAGLKGFNSLTFKQKLEDYVVNGGNLLVFTQKYGADFSVLPGNIDGYGWNEDQSCYFRAAYLNRWHPVFAGQRYWEMTCNVDGYISEYPDNARVLLARTKNSLPALLYYNYGAGTVIVSSLYTDWGYGHYQRSGAELNLIRDLTTWAQNPDREISEFYSNSAVSVPVSIKYTANDTIPAASAIVKVYTPDRKLYDSLTIPVSLNSGEETEWIWDKSSISYNLGLWVIDYALMDGSGKWIQGYKRGAVFAQKIKVKVGNYNLNDFQLWVTSNKEEILAGDTIDFEVSIKNNTDSSFTGKLIVAINHRTVAADSFLNLTLPPDSTVYINYKKNFSNPRTMRFGLYESDQYNYARDLRNAIAFNHKGFMVIRDPFELSLSRDKYQYLLGFDTVHYAVIAENKLSYPCSLFVNTYTLLDSVRYDIRSDTVELAAKGTKEIEDAFFPMDYDTTLGKGKLCSELFYRDKLWKSKSVSFELTYPQVHCSLVFPDSFNYEGSNPYTVTLTSEGSFIPTGKLLIGGNNFSDSVIIGNIPSPETTFVFNYSPDVWEIPGRLDVQYELQGQTVSKGASLPFSSPSISGFKPQYQVPQGGFLPGDTAEFKAQLSLKGGLYGVPAELCLWSDYLGADTLRNTIILNPCSHRTVEFKTYTDVSIPADTPISYNYRMKYLNKEYTNSGELTYFITPPEAVLDWPVNDTFSIGSTIPIRFNNSIKTSSRVDIQSISIHGSDIEEPFRVPGEVTVPAEGYYTFPITVPDLKKGQYRLKIISEMVEGNGVNLYSYTEGCPIYIDGIESDIEVSTSKKYYGYGEDIPFSSLLENGQYGWNGAESLKVARVNDSLGRFSIWDLSDNVETFGLVSDGSGGLVLDAGYSLRPLKGNRVDFSVYEVLFDLDDFGNFWIYYSLLEADSFCIEKRTDMFSDPVEVFTFPDYLGEVVDMEVHQGIIYLSSLNAEAVLKISSSSGDSIGYICPPSGPFIGVGGIAVKEDGNILVLERGTSILWEFSSFGDSISAFVLPVSFYISQGKDIECDNDIVYIPYSDMIIKVEVPEVDYLLEGYYCPCERLAIADNGNIFTFMACGEGGGNGLISFTPEGEPQGFSQDCWIYDLNCYGNDVITYGYDEASLGGFSMWKMFGKDYGMLRIQEFSNIPDRYRLHSSKTYDDPKYGSISYNFLGPKVSYPDEDNLLPLESMYGTDSLPPLYISMQGNWQNSPVFYACSLDIKLIDAIDSLIVGKEYPLNLSAFGNVSFADTIKDTIPPADYCVFGDAYSEYPQHITSDWESFTVIGDNVTLLLESDKEECFSGDTIGLNPIAVNPLPLQEDNLRLLIRGYYSESETTYVDTSFNLLAESADSFPFTITPEEPVVVRAELIMPSSDTVLREFVPLIQVSKLLSLNLKAPDLVDFLPFEVRSKVYNHSFDALSVEVKRIFLSDTLRDVVVIEREGFCSFVDTFTTEEPGTLKVVAKTGGEVFTEERFISFGMNGVVVLDSLYEVSSDSIEMSGVIRNDGVYPLEGNALFCLVESETELPAHGLQLTALEHTADSLRLTATYSSELTANSSQLTANLSTTKELKNSTASLLAKRIALSSVYRVGRDITLSQFAQELAEAGVDTSFSLVSLTPGKADTVPIVFNHHDVGGYDLQAYLFTGSLSFMFDSAYSTVNVVGNDQVFVDSLIVSENCDSNGNVILDAIIENQSYVTFTGDIAISSINCYEYSSIEIAGSSKDTVVFLIEDVFDEGVYTFTSTISEGGVAVSEGTQDLEFHPVYRFDSLPVGLEVSTPDSGIMRVPVINIGNARGERNIRVNFADVIRVDEDAIIEPAYIDTFTDNFLIPEDFPGGKYFADASIFGNLYPEVDTFFNVKVNGLIIQARDSLDKLVYNVDDTAELSILVENQSLWSGDLFVSLQYGDLELDTSFVLGGMEKGVLNTSENRDTLYLDTSGVYMFAPISSSSYDSVSINCDVSLIDSINVQVRTDSLFGKGSWISIEKDTVYPVNDWTQLTFSNISHDNQWINSLVLNFKPSDSIVLDTFPVQKEIIVLNVPVDSSQTKLGWGIFYPSGRSVVLDERYINLSDSLLTLFTDKGRYEIFDTVHATLIKNFPDTNYSFEYRVYFSPTEEIWDTFDLVEDATNFSFVIPEWTRSGTYSIDYVVEEAGLLASSLQLTADGLQLTAKELTANSLQLTANQLTNQPIIQSTDSGRKSTPLAKQWVMGKQSFRALGDSAFISGEHLFDVDGITVYFKSVKMDTNLYYEGDTAKIRTEISTDTDLGTLLTISSTGSAVNEIDLELEKDVSNKFEFKYPLEDCRRGMNELYLHLSKDSVSLAGVVLYFDVYVSDTIAPVISILEEPSNTYSSSKTHQVRARIYNPDTNGTPFHDTLYYRAASVGGSSWNALLPHSMRGDTHKYLIPSHPNGTHIEYNLIARDEFGNRAKYPEEGNSDFWILSPLKPTWEQLTYLADTSAVLIWNPPEELIYYHCGLSSDTIDIKENMIATRFISQCLPARLKTIGLEIVNENGTASPDTLLLSVYTVAEDSLPGTKIDSFEFTGTLEGYTEFDLADVQIPEEGIFIGIKGSDGLNAILDGFGEGRHTAINSGSSWSLVTSGELLIDGIVSHLPTPKLRGFSEILTFDVFRATEPSDWIKIASGLTSTTYTDQAVLENREYSYKVMTSFGNPVDSFFSTSREVFIDLTPPEMDTVVVNDMGEDELVIWAILTDTSGIAWDSLGYKDEDVINVITEDSIKNNQYFFSITFAGDTLEFFLKAQDSSLIGNYARYPKCGFYKWGLVAGIFEESIPDSTYLFRMLNVLTSRSIEIRYALSQESDVKIMFFDVLGRKAKTLVDKTQKAGYYSVPIESSALPQGVYFLRMEAGNYRKSVKLVKLR